MIPYLALRTVHEIGAFVLLLTGAWIALFSLRAHVSRDVKMIDATAYDMRLPEILFTALTLVVQPASGGLLMSYTGADWHLPWLSLALLLYAVACADWIVALTFRVALRRLIRNTAATGAALAPSYDRLFWISAALGAGSLVLFGAVFVLMTVKPAIF